MVSVDVKHHVYLPMLMCCSAFVMAEEQGPKILIAWGKWRKKEDSTSKATMSYRGERGKRELVHLTLRYHFVRK